MLITVKQSKYLAIIVIYNILCFILSLDALLTNVNVGGLSEYKVIDGDFQVIGMKLNINLSWPLITASTDYDMNGSVDSYEFYGNGEIE